MLRQLLKNLNALNIILVAVIVLFLHFRLEPRLNTKPTFNPKAAVEKTDENPAAEAQEETKLAPQEYKIIADSNLFHPDRKIPKAVVQKQEVQLPPADFVLYGTMITDDVKLAFVDDRKAPYTTPGGGKRSRTLKIGDTLSGYTLKDIDQDKVVMVRGGEELILKKSLSQDKKPTPTGQAHRPQPFTRGTQPAYTPPAQSSAPTPPTIITVPAVSAQPAPQPAAPKTPAPPSSAAPKTQQQPHQQQNKTPYQQPK